MENIEIYTPAPFYSATPQIIKSKLQLKGIECSGESGDASKIAMLTWIESMPAEDIFTHIRELHLADYKIIVLNLAVNLPDGIKWQLIAAGAGDVIDWQDEDISINIIHARIKRWKTIEELMEINMVKE